MTSTKRLRFALIGTGDFGPHFAPYINASAELVAVSDPNPRARARFAEQTGLQLPEFDDHERLLAEINVDAVVIASPNHTHQEIAVAAGGIRAVADSGVFAIVTMVAGDVVCGSAEFGPGDFFLVPAGAEGATREIRVGAQGAKALRTTRPSRNRRLPPVRPRVNCRRGIHRSTPGRTTA